MFLLSFEYDNGFALHNSIHVADCEISPGNNYIIQSVSQCDDITNEASYTNPVDLATPDDAGDVTGGGNPGDPSNGATGSLVDVFAIILGFQRNQNEDMDRLDAAPSVGDAVPNGIVGLDDAFQVIVHFQQNPYPGPAPLDCP